MFANMVPLDPERHAHKRILRPSGYDFAQSWELIPIGFSEIVPCSMWYPVFFARREERYGVFAMLGAGNTNIFVNPDGTWKTGIIPSLVRAYPFSLSPTPEGDFTILVDESALTEEKGEPLFEEKGQPSPYLENIKTELTRIAQDLHRAESMLKEVAEEGLLTLLSVKHSFTFGSLDLKNALTTNMHAFIKIKPEKLYYFNTKGYLPLLFTQNFSLRNFALFEIFKEYQGQIPF
ncbi:SapC family protein [Thermosulfurimonas marina]|uniref:SapC family protein n=1 Tax=Thermosulfurimonas marina TaxID=2047767 RepID=A0A6H1WTP9_9BACT|nr:SapC family protein [Thermosulfurimonas marina]QJA06551.1 SapC family protein [Thermosulfurimonas marina]